MLSFTQADETDAVVELVDVELGEDDPQAAKPVAVNIKPANSPLRACFTWRARWR